MAFLLRYPAAHNTFLTGLFTVGVKSGPLSMESGSEDFLFRKGGLAKILSINFNPDRTLDPDWGQSELEDAMMKWHGDAIKESRNRELVSLAIASYMSRYKGL